MSTGASVIDRLRRPEYTGENRCVPCTAVNLVIACLLAVGVWAALAAAGTRPAFAPLALGAAVFLLAVAAIYLRGYLVPGTPWFTKTYFPDWLLRAFEKAPATESPAGAAVAGGARTGGEDGREFDVEAVLEDAGATEECADADDLCLVPAFREAWRAEVEAIRDAEGGPRERTTALGADLTVNRRGEVLVARADGAIVGQWESEAAFLADVAAAEVLAERYPPWADFGVAERGAVLNGLRLFVERCPSCDGRVTFGEEVVESCCRFADVVAVTCEDCGARLFEAEVDEAA